MSTRRGWKWGAVGAGLTVAAMSSCGPKAPEFRPVMLTSDQAVLYIYRPGEGIGGGGPVNIVVNQEPAATLVGGDYWAKVVPPGEYLVRVEGGSSAVARVGAHAGESLYLRVRNAGLITKTTIDEVDPAVGQQQIAQTNEAVAKS